jgi:ABC-type lipoprotein release transport system permease subunit
MDVKMAWRNIWRNPRRTVLTVAAIAFASLLLVFMLSFQFGSYDAMINASVKINTGHIQVQAKDYKDKQSIRLVVPNPDAIGDILNRMPQLEAYTFRAKAFSLASSNERAYGVVVVGIDPAKEAGVSTLKTLVHRGGYLPADYRNNPTPPALVGKLLARNLKVGPGDELTVLGQGRDGSIAATVVKITGIYSSGIDEFDRSSIQIPLKHFQDVYAMDGAVHEVIAVAKSLKHLAKIKTDLSAKINQMDSTHPLIALDWEELMPGLRQAIQMDLVSGIIFYMILILVVAFSILNTFLMAIFERTKEFGVLMAMGTTPGRLAKLLLIESISMTMVGIVVGTILGSLITWYFQIHGINIAGSSEILRQYGISGRMYPQLSLLSASCGPAAVLLITFMAALYPALKVRGLRPAEALTYT